MGRKYEPEFLVQLATINPTWSNRKIAESIGVDEASVRRAFRSAGFNRKVIPVDHVERYQETLDVPLRVYSNNCAITADWHIPLYDPTFVNTFLQTCNDLDIRELVIAGDFLNGDALSQYWPKQENANAIVERQEAHNVMRLLLANFDTIYYIWGNHDYRYVKSSGYSVPYDKLMAGFFSPVLEGLDEGRMVFSNLDHLYIVADSGEYYVCHPRTYSGNPLASAIKMAGKLVGSHVLTAHSHHCAVGYAMDGERVVAELGGFHSKERTQYLQRSTNYPNWQNGFGLIVDGKFELHGRYGLLGRP